jgi:hypothetical protein
MFQITNGATLKIEFGDEKMKLRDTNWDKGLLGDYSLCFSSGNQFGRTIQ